MWLVDVDVNDDGCHSFSHSAPWMDLLIACTYILPTPTSYVPLQTQIYLYHRTYTKDMYFASSALRPRQMSSASALIGSYIDRFRVVLPSRGDVVFLDSD